LGSAGKSTGKTWRRVTHIVTDNNVTASGTNFVDEACGKGFHHLFSEL
jgi:hypothetical protein